MSTLLEKPDLEVGIVIIEATVVQQDDPDMTGKELSEVAEVAEEEELLAAENSDSS